MMLILFLLILFLLVLLLLLSLLSLLIGLSVTLLVTVGGFVREYVGGF